MRTKLRGKITLLFMMFGLLLAIPAVALADQIQNDVATSLDPNDAGKKVLSVTAGQTSAQVGYKIASSSNDPSVPSDTGSHNCNPVQTGTPADITITGLPTGVTVQDTNGNTLPAPSTTYHLRFTTCETLQYVKFSVASSVAAGDYQIGVKDLSTASPDPGTNDGYNESPAAFILRVTAPQQQNNAPTVSIAAQDANGTEGDTLQASGAFSDADGDTLSLSANNTEGTFDGDNGDGTWSWSLSTNDDVTGGTIRVTADDGNGGTVFDEFTYSAANANPSATFNKPTSSVDEGSNFNLSLSSVLDAGSADTHEYRFDCGSGFGAWGASSSVQCSAGDGPNTLNVKGQVRDDDGGLSTEYSGSVSVINLAPVVTLAGADPQSVNENNGGSENFNFSVSDPGGDTITSVSADCDADSGTDDGFLQGSQPTVSNLSFSCRFPDGPASAEVKASATDDDGATGSDSKTVNVDNVAPTLSNLQVTGGSQTACLVGGNSVSITFAVSDPGVDTFTRSVNWGDGNTDALLSHTYNSAGTFTIKVNGQDSDNAAANELVGNNAVSLLYNMSGILSPFNPDGSSTWKYGSTIPVKVKITDCAGTPVSGLAPKLGLSLANAATPSGTINETDITSTSAADNPNAPVLRYDALAGQYIYNLSTKYTAAFTDPNATYWAVVRGLSQDGTTVVTNPASAAQKFGLKSK